MNCQSQTLAIAPRGLLLINTANLASGTGGSVTISHDAPYGALVAMAVSLEPCTGFSCDAPGQPRWP